MTARRFGRFRPGRRPSLRREQQEGRRRPPECPPNRILVEIPEDRNPHCEAEDTQSGEAPLEQREDVQTDHQELNRAAGIQIEARRAHGPEPTPNASIEFARRILQADAEARPHRTHLSLRAETAALVSA
jgi:hypothetical protein